MNLQLNDLVGFVVALFAIQVIRPAYKLDLVKSDICPADCPKREVS